MGFFRKKQFGPRGETNAGWLRGLALGIGLLGLIFLYVLTQFSGLPYAESMDYAQLGRSLARGEGFHTQIVRPLALAAMRDRDYLQHHPIPTESQSIPAAKADLAGFRDTFSPPLYPFALSLGFRLTGNYFDFTMEDLRRSHIYRPEYVITIFNLLGFLLTAALTYVLALRLFDERVARLSGVLYLVCEIHWQYAISGLSTTWSTLLLLGSMTLLHQAIKGQEEADERLWPSRICLIASAALLGLATLSRYSFLWLVPLFLAAVALSFRHRPWLAPMAGLVILLLFLPWLIRNLSLTGAPLGHSTLLVGLNDGAYPGTSLLRSYHLDANTLLWKESLRKLFHGIRHLLTTGYSNLGSNMTGALFLVSFLHLYKRPRANILRLLTLTGAIALTIGASFVKPDPQTLDEANQLVLFAPLITIFGSAFFFILMDRWEIEYPYIRSLLLSSLVLVQAAPLIITLLLHEAPPFAYPPYFPPVLKLTGNWLKKSELTMSDIPWGTAWYGDRTSLWLPTTVKEFYEIDDFVCTDHISTILLTPVTGDSKLLTEIDKGEWKDWASIIRRQGLPKGFPLSVILPIEPNTNEYLILADRNRWQ